jgi:hypothetical protein
MDVYPILLRRPPETDPRSTARAVTEKRARAERTKEQLATVDLLLAELYCVHGRRQDVARPLFNESIMIWESPIARGADAEKGRIQQMTHVDLSSSAGNESRALNPRRSRFSRVPTLGTNLTMGGAPGDHRSDVEPN